MSSSVLIVKIHWFADKLRDNEKNMIKFILFLSDFGHCLLKFHLWPYYRTLLETHCWWTSVRRCSLKGHRFLCCRLFSFIFPFFYQILFITIINWRSLRIYEVNIDNFTKCGERNTQNNLRSKLTISPSETDTTCWSDN